MTSWTVRLGDPARKSVERAPRPESDRLRAALGEMARDPFSGDVARLTNQRTAFRRRVGNWRIFFDVYPEARVVDVPLIERRGSTTYRKRR